MTTTESNIRLAARILFIGLVLLLGFAFWYLSTLFKAISATPAASLLTFLGVVCTAVAGCLITQKNRPRNAAIGAAAFLAFSVLMSIPQTMAASDPGAEFARLFNPKGQSVSEWLVGKAPASLVYIIRVTEDIRRVTVFSKALHEDIEEMCPRMGPEKLMTCYRLWLMRMHAKKPLTFAGQLVMASVPLGFLDELAKSKKSSDKAANLRWQVTLGLELGAGMILNTELMRNGIAHAPQILGRKPNPKLTVAAAAYDARTFKVSQTEQNVVELVDSVSWLTFLKSIGAESGDGSLADYYSKIEKYRKDMLPEQVRFLDQQKLWLAGYQNWVRKEVHPRLAYVLNEDIKEAQFGAQMRATASVK